MEKNDLLKKVDFIKERISADTLLEELCRSLDSDELEDALSFVCRMYDMNYVMMYNSLDELNEIEEVINHINNR